jgi:hypothetical protein
LNAFQRAHGQLTLVEPERRNIGFLFVALLAETILDATEYTFGLAGGFAVYLAQGKRAAVLTLF